MDLSQLPQIGVASALVFVIVYLLAANRADRAQSRELRTHDRTEIRELQERIDALEAEVDTERDKRRAAQDTAAGWERRAVAAEAREAALSDVIERTRRGDSPATTQLPPSA